jgi:hypothetical protein
MICVLTIFCNFAYSGLTRLLYVIRWKKPTNAQGFCKQFIVLIKSPTCFGIQMPSSGGYLFFLSYSSFSLRFGWMVLLFAWCGHLLQNASQCLQHPWALVGLFYRIMKNARYNDQDVVCYVVWCMLLYCIVLFYIVLYTIALSCLTL